MKLKASRWTYLALAAALTALDQIVKAAVQARLGAPHAQNISLIPGCLELELSVNTGIAFGLFKGMKGVLILLTPAVGVVLLFFILTQPATRLSLFGLSMMAAGAAGNFIDRLRLGHVVDFIRFYVKSFSWPNFNFADAFIVIGVGLFFLGGFGGLLEGGAPAREKGEGGPPGAGRGSKT